MLLSRQKDGLLIRHGRAALVAAFLALGLAFIAAPNVTRNFDVGIEVPQETLHLPTLERQ